MSRQRGRAGQISGLSHDFVSPLLCLEIRHSGGGGGRVRPEKLRIKKVNKGGQRGEEKRERKPEQDIANQERRYKVRRENRRG